MTKFAMLTAGVVLVAGLGFVLDAQSRVRVVRSEPSGESETIFAVGRVEGATPEIELRPRLAGRIVELLVQEGQFVEKGAVLLRLDDQQYRHEVALAAAELDLAEARLERLLNGARAQQRTEAAALCRAKQADLERAELSWNRVNQLRRARAISQQEADNQRTLVAALTGEVEAARARLELLEAPARPDEVQMEKARVQVAKARLELAKVQLERTKLRAPSRGQVLKTHVETGELTGPTSTEPALVLADTSRFHVRAFVEEMDAPRVQLGMATKIVADGLPDQQFQGRVSRLSPRMDRKELWSDQPAERYDTKTREVWIELDQGEALVVGLRVDVMIDPESCTAVPTTRSVGHGSCPADGRANSEGAKPTGQSPSALPPLARSTSNGQ
jgi:ABC exporter DevB family membrane fusion protein